VLICGTDWLLTTADVWWPTVSVANGGVQIVANEPYPFASLSFKSYVPIGGIVLAQAPEVGQVVAKINEIEADHSVPSYLF